MNSTLLALPAAPEVTRDAEILDRVRAGDRAAFGLLYERDEFDARRFATRFVAARDVDDVVSEAFARVLSAINNGGGPRDNHLKYLLVTVRHTAFDLLRRKTPEPVDEVQVAPVRPIDDAIERLVDDRMQAAFDGLLPRWKVILWWTEVESLSMAEVGERLGISSAAAAALAYRARTGLRAAYLGAEAHDVAPR